jgi:hypothetical protein
MVAALVSRVGPGRFRIKMGPDERQALVACVAQLRSLLSAEDPSSDPAVARLFPAAYPEDVFSNLEWERTHTPQLLLHKLEALDVVEATIGREELNEDELLAWLGSLNSTRLVLGTRLDITEESRRRDFAGDEETAGLFDLYAYLTWLEGDISLALTAELDASSR